MLGRWHLSLCRSFFLSTSTTGGGIIDCLSHSSTIQTSIMTFSLWMLLIQSFVFSALASPVLSEEHSQQSILSTLPSPKIPTYENGELPPVKDTVGWADPRLNGGRFIDVSNKCSCSRISLHTLSSSQRGDLGSLLISLYPLYLIRSYSKILVFASTPGKSSLRKHTVTERLTCIRRSIGYFSECLGLHYGHIHEADLGDGLGRKDEHILFRQHYIPVIGTCWESVRGGHHFRAWKQNGTLANTGAWFIGCARFTFKGCSCQWEITNLRYDHTARRRKRLTPLRQISSYRR